VSHLQNSIFSQKELNFEDATPHAAEFSLQKKLLRVCHNLDNIGVGS